MNKNNFIFNKIKMSRVISYNINPNLNVQTGSHKTYFIIKGNNPYLKPNGDMMDSDEIEEEKEKQRLEETKEEDELMSADDIRIKYSVDFWPENFYFNYDTYDFIFYYPQDFIAPSETGEDKYIIFQYCHCVVNKSTTSDYEIHSNIIPRDTFCDSLVYYCNLQPPDDNRKYRVNTNKKMGFNVWFTDYKGNRIIPDYFTVFLKLIY